MYNLFITQTRLERPNKLISVVTFAIPLHIWFSGLILACPLSNLLAFQHSSLCSVKDIKIHANYFFMCCSVCAHLQMQGLTYSIHAGPVWTLVQTLLKK